MRFTTYAERVVRDVVEERLWQARAALPPDFAARIAVVVVSTKPRRSAAAGSAGWRRTPEGLRVSLWFNPDMFNTPSRLALLIRTTVPHEVAHLADWAERGKLGHGAGWRHWCRTLGFDASSRFHSFLIAGRFQYRCVHGHVHYCNAAAHDKAASYWFSSGGRSALYRCRVCKSDLLFTGGTVNSKGEVVMTREPFTVPAVQSQEVANGDHRQQMLSAGSVEAD